MLRPKQTIAACAIHLPNVLAELAVSYMTPTVAGIEAAIEVGNYELCKYERTIDTQCVGMALDSQWPAIVDMLLCRLPASAWDPFNKDFTMSNWIYHAREQGDTEMAAVLSAHGASYDAMEKLLRRWDRH